MIDSFVYFVRSGENGPIKIGTTSNIENRVASLQTGSPYKLEVLLVVQGTLRHEFHLHQRFAHERMVGEWFRGDGRVAEFVESLRSMTVSEIEAAILATDPPVDPDEDPSVAFADEYADWERLRNACFAVIRDLGIENCAREMTRIWGAEGRPVSVNTLVRTLSGEFNLRAEWLPFFRRKSAAVEAAVQSMLERIRRARLTQTERDAEDDARARLAALHATAIEELGPKQAEALLRRARAR